MRTEAPYRMPVYRGIFHFIAAHLRTLIHKLLQLGMRDAWNRQLYPGDRVFNLDSYYDADREHGDPAHYGTVVLDDRSITGLAIQWDNNELTQLINPSSLIKKTV